MLAPKDKQMRPLVRARSQQLDRGVRRGTLQLCGVFAVGLVVGAWAHSALGQQTVAPPEPAADATAPVAAAPAPVRPRNAPRSRASARPKPFLVRPAIACEGQDEEGQREYREQQSKELVDLMLMHLGAYQRTHVNEPAEAAINDMALYHKGLMDGIARTAPDLADELSERIEHDLCRPGMGDAQLMLLGRTLQEMPELASEKGFSCIFQQRKGEDMVLWTMLDAWRDSGLPETPALVELAQRARDERTRARFLSREPAPAPVAPVEGPTVIEGTEPEPG
jgi:hypothetical protein